MKIFKVEVVVDYDGRRNTLGYVECETPAQAALYFYLKGKNSSLDSEYAISEIDVVIPDSLTASQVSHLDVTTKKADYGSGMQVKIKTKEEIIKAKRAAVERAISDVISKTGLSREEILKTIGDAK